MTSRQSRAAGLTLVELLLSMAIVGVIFLAVISLTRGALTYSAQVDGINDRLVELNDAMGYIALNARRSARLIEDSDDLSIFYGGTGGEFMCTTGATDPCVAMIVPVVDRDDADILGYELLAYRVAPISAWSDNPGLPMGRDGEDTKVLLEYKAELCSCTSPPALSTSSISVDSVSLLLPDLYLVDSEGGSNSPFRLFGQDQLHISLRLWSSATDQVIPGNRPAEVVVSRRH